MSNSRIDILEKREEVITYVNEGKTIGELSILFNCRWSTMSKYLKLMNIETLHKVKIDTYDFKDSLKKNFYVGHTTDFKWKLIRNGFKEHKCENCFRTEWEGDRIPIELHHKDGDRSNNEIENLQILCPNCHTLTDNYKSKKIRKDVDVINSYYCDCGDFKWSTSKKCFECYKKETYKNPTRPKKNKKDVIKRKPAEFVACYECDKEYRKSSKKKKFCSKTCVLTNKSKHLPSREHLLEDFKILKSFVQVGIKYNVSDTAVRKWCVKYNIPVDKADLNDYLISLSINEHISE